MSVLGASQVGGVVPEDRAALLRAGERWRIPQRVIQGLCTVVDHEGDIDSFNFENHLEATLREEAESWSVRAAWWCELCDSFGEVSSVDGDKILGLIEFGEPRPSLRVYLCLRSTSGFIGHILTFAERLYFSRSIIDYEWTCPATPRDTLCVPYIDCSGCSEATGPKAVDISLPARVPYMDVDNARTGAVDL